MTAQKQKPPTRPGTGISPLPLFWTILTLYLGAYLLWTTITTFVLDGGLAQFCTEYQSQVCTTPFGKQLQGAANHITDTFGGAVIILTALAFMTTCVLPPMGKLILNITGIPKRLQGPVDRLKEETDQTAEPTSGR